MLQINFSGTDEQLGDFKNEALGFQAAWGFTNTLLRNGETVTALRIINSSTSELASNQSHKYSACSFAVDFLTDWVIRHPHVDSVKCLRPSDIAKGRVEFEPVDAWGE